MDNKPEETKASDGRGWFVLHGLVMFAMVGFIYSGIGWRGGPPPGHPWSGLCLSLLGLQAILYGLQKRYAILSKFSLVVSVAVIVTAINWVVSASGSKSRQITTAPLVLVSLSVGFFIVLSLATYQLLRR